MNENPYLDLAITVACERFNLEEEKWALKSFNESSSSISIALEHNDIGTKLRLAFSMEDMVFEDIKRWSDDRKISYLQKLMASEKELAPELYDSFQHIFDRIETGMTKDEEESSVLVEEEPENVTEDAEGKKPKRKKFKRKVV